MMTMFEKDTPVLIHLNCGISYIGLMGDSTPNGETIILLPLPKKKMELASPFLERAVPVPGEMRIRESSIMTVGKLLTQKEMEKYSGSISEIRKLNDQD